MLSPFDMFLIIFLVFPRVGKNTVLISRNPGYQGQVKPFMYFNNNHEPDRFGKDAKNTDFPDVKNIHQNEMRGFF